MHAATSPTPRPETKPASADNPLLSASTLPYQMPPFDKIKSEHFSPAYGVALAEHLKEVEAIAESKEEPTFENTIVALEKSGVTLTRVGNIFSNLAGAHTNPVLQKTESEMAPKLAAHEDAIRLNTALFARIQKLYDQRAIVYFAPCEQQLLRMKVNRSAAGEPLPAEAASRRRFRASGVPSSDE